MLRRAFLRRMMAGALAASMFRDWAGILTPEVSVAWENVTLTKVMGQFEVSQEVVDMLSPPSLALEAFEQDVRNRTLRELDAMLDSHFIHGPA